MANNSDPFNIFDPDTRGPASPLHTSMPLQEILAAAEVDTKPVQEVESHATDTRGSTSPSRTIIPAQETITTATADIEPALAAESQDTDTRGSTSSSHISMPVQETLTAATVEIEPTLEAKSQDTDKASTSITVATPAEIAASELHPAQEPSAPTTPHTTQISEPNAVTAVNPRSPVTEVAKDQLPTEQELDTPPSHSTPVCDLDTSAAIVPATSLLEDSACDSAQDLIASPSHSKQTCNEDVTPAKTPGASKDLGTSTSHSTPTCSEDITLARASDFSKDLDVTFSHSTQICNEDVTPAKTPGASKELDTSTSHSKSICSEDMTPVKAPSASQDVTTSPSHSTQTCNVEATPNKTPSVSAVDTAVDEPHPAQGLNAPSSSKPIPTPNLDTVSSAEFAADQDRSTQEPLTPTSHPTQNEQSGDKSPSTTTDHNTTSPNTSVDEVSVAPEAAAPIPSHLTQTSDSASIAAIAIPETAIPTSEVVIGCDLPPPGHYLDLITWSFNIKDEYPGENILEILDRIERMGNTMRKKEEEKIEYNGKPWEQSWGLFRIVLQGIQISLDVKIAAVEHFLDQMKTDNWSEDRSLPELEAMLEKLDHMIAIARQEAITKRTIIEYSNAKQTIKIHMWFKEENTFFDTMQREGFFKDKFLLALLDLQKDLDAMRSTANLYGFGNKKSTDYNAAQQKLQSWIALRQSEVTSFNKKKHLSHSFPPSIRKAQNAEKLPYTIYHSTGVQTRLITKPPIFEQVYGEELTEAEFFKIQRSIGRLEHVDHSQFNYGDPFIKHISTSNTQPETCDSGFQTMDYITCEKKILKAEAKAKDMASKVDNAARKRKIGIRVFAEPSNDRIVHSQQYRPCTTINKDLVIEHIGSSTPRINNIVYDEIEEQRPHPIKRIKLTAHDPTAESSGKSTTNPEKTEGLQSIPSYCGSPAPGRYEQDQKKYPHLFNQGWPMRHFPIDTVNGAYSPNVTRDYTIPDPKRGHKIASAPAEKQEPSSPKPSQKRKRNESPQGGANSEEPIRAKRPRLPPQEETLRVIYPGKPKPGSRGPIQRAPLSRTKAEPGETQRGAETPRATPAPAPAAAPAPAPTPGRGGKAPRKPTANRGEVRAGFQPYSAAQRRHHRK